MPTPTPTPTPTPVRYEVLHMYVGRFKQGEILTVEQMFPGDPEPSELLARLVNMQAIRLIHDGEGAAAR